MKLTAMNIGIGVLILAIAAALVMGVNGGWFSAASAKNEAPAPTEAAAPDSPAPDAPAAPDAAGTDPAASDPNATTPDPATTATASEPLPVYRCAPDHIVVGRAFNYNVRPEGKEWAVVKSALCNIGKGKSAKVSRDQYRECLVPTRDIAIQICDLQATWKARQLAEPDPATDPSVIEEFELSTGEFCYVDDDAGKIWVAQKSDTGQHHNRWLFASAAPGQAGKIFARLKQELKLRHDELVARRKAENTRLEEAGVVPAS